MDVYSQGLQWTHILKHNKAMSNLKIWNSALTKRLFCGSGWGSNVSSQTAGKVLTSARATETGLKYLPYLNPEVLCYEL